ncbi:MAG: CvpA family protein [Nitrospinae bacterium]|nr:CvpA family protein [Nitrospinota bacterium]
MNLIDIGIIVLLCISMVYSLVRGFIKEVFSFGAIIIGFLMANQFYQDLSYYLSRLIRNSIVKDIVGFAIIFIVTAILISLIGRFMRRLLRKEKTLSIIDRLAGGMIGLLKGVLILSLILIPINIFPFLKTEMASKSRIVPYLMVISKELVRLSFSESDISKKIGGNTIMKDAKRGLSQGVNSIKKGLLDKLDRKGWIKKKVKGDISSPPNEDISEDDKANLEKLLKENP